MSAAVVARRVLRPRRLSGVVAPPEPRVFAQPWTPEAARFAPGPPKLSSELPASSRWPATDEAREQVRLEVVGDVTRARRAYEAGARVHRYGRALELDLDMLVGRL